jgi:scyllo-inositol 2-dehydrogenase (NADP+)
VYAEVRAQRAGAEVDDDCFLSLTHASGASSLLWCSAAAPWTGPRLVLQGSKAGWVKQDLDGQEDAQRRGVPVPQEPPGALWSEDGEDEVPSLQGDWPAFYRAFADAVTTGSPVPVDPADAVTVLQVLEAAAASSDRRETVHLA